MNAPTKTKLVRAPTPLSIRETFAGKRVLVTGVSGFVGKVWLTMALTRVPDIGRVYVLLRGKGRSAQDRFERIVAESMVFSHLHEQHGAGMSAFISERVEVVGGDVSLPDLGLEPAIARKLREDVDLVINCAGLVEFNPDVREAVAANVDGAVRVAEFVESCRHAALLHVSTCYVAGQRDGFISEEVCDDRTPNGRPIAAAAAYASLQDAIRAVEQENDLPATEQQLTRDILARIGERGSDPGRLTEMVGRLKRKRLREMMAHKGTELAKALGWPNTYTYTKALAELMLRARGPALRLAIFRPAIVESALSFPFAGWNEGFNTSGPLVYLAGTWFRHVPAKPGNPLDIIPVDQICNALFIVGAALMRGEAREVYQCGSSDRNMLTIDRLTELSALGHRKHLRARGARTIDKLVLSRWDALASDPDNVFRVPNLREAVLQVRRYLRHGLPERIPSEVREWANDLADTADTAQRKLRQVEEILDLFMPFTYDHYCLFESRAIDAHPVIEPEFRFAPENIEWRSYWLDIHMPGLRRWCFPKYENKPIDKYRPGTPFRLLAPAESESEDAFTSGSRLGGGTLRRVQETG